MFFILISLCLSVASAQGTYELNILHYNDFHARFVETSPLGTVCNPETAPCIGGFARLATAVREGLAREPNSLVLNAGDSFQGTIWYNILRWNVTQDFMNMFHHDAHVLGNHEFDNGIEGVVPYLQYLDAPVVTANIIDDDEPTIKGLYQPSIVVEKNGRRIGIIGVIIATTNTLASTGQLRFTDEVETVRIEAEKLHEQGIDIIVVLSHCGLEIDRDIALHGGPHIDIIVGGHSHTLLYNEAPPEYSAFVPAGPYPVVVDQPTRKVLIVQAAAHTQYLGEIKLYFDDAGNLLEWDGHPHYIGNEVEQAADVLEKIEYYRPMIDELATQELGSSMVHLRSSCACSECNLGNFICDAFMHAALPYAEEGHWQRAHFCVINQGGIRVDIEPGTITFESMLLSTPFENNVEMFKLRGDHIMEMLEFSVANDPYPGARMLQVSGLQVVFDGARPLNERVVSVRTRCIDCSVPHYEPLRLDRNYTVVSQSFLGTGGDGFSYNWTKILWHAVGPLLKPNPGGAAIEGYKHHLHFSICQMSNPIASAYASIAAPPGFGFVKRATLKPPVARPVCIKTVFDGSRPRGSRVLSVSVRCIDCSVPRYEPLVPEKYYRVITTDFIGAGGGNFTMISENRFDVVVIGVDYDLLMQYIMLQTPVFVDESGRIQISNPCLDD